MSEYIQSPTAIKRIGRVHVDSSSVGKTINDIRINPFLNVSVFGKNPTEIIHHVSAVYEGKQHVGDDECLLFSVALDSYSKSYIWISTSHGYHIKRFEHFEKEPGNDYGGSCLVSEVTSFKKVNGYWFPNSGVQVSWFLSNDMTKRSISYDNWDMVNSSEDAPIDLFSPCQSPLSYSVVGSSLPASE
jgi:hypothetical protein